MKIQDERVFQIRPYRYLAIGIILHRRFRLEDFTFHDLHHCAINNLRQAENDYFKIMVISGHKTISVFKRYNLVTEEELVQVKWADQIDTKQKRGDER